jgi:hypothetical protein
MAAACLFAAVLAAYLATASGSLSTQDAAAVYAQTKSLVERGAIDVPLEISGERWLGIDGRYHLPFGIGQAVYNMPFYAAGRLAVRLTGIRVGGSEEPILKASVALGNTVAAAICVVIVFLFSWRVSTSTRDALLAALVCAFGSPMWPYSKFGFNAAVTAAAVSIGIYGLYVGKTTRRVGPCVWGALALGAAVMTRHEMLLAGMAGFAWLALADRPWDRIRRMQVVVVGGLLATAACAWMGFNLIRFGQPFEAGFAPAFGAMGIVGLLASPAASIVVYCPLTVVGLAGLRRLLKYDHPSGSLIGGVSLVLFVFYALMDDWIGTRSYGPRYLVPLLPLMFVALSVGRCRTATGALKRPKMWVTVATLSVLVQIPAVTMNFVTVRGLSGHPTPNQAPFAWASAPVVQNTIAMGPAIAANLGALAGRRPPAAEQAPDTPLPAGSELSSKLSFSLDFWWLYLFHLGKLSAATAVAAPVVLLLISIGLLLYVKKMTAAPATAPSREITS